MQLTLEQLKQIMPRARDRAGLFLGPIHAACAEFGIDQPRRLAMFLAQVAHESAELRFVKELGSESYLARYDTGRLAARLGNSPEADGDGQRYCGRGLIQITGRSNYVACGAALGLSLIDDPEQLEEPLHAVRSAAWFWSSRGLNELADKNAFDAITQRINGGQNGRDERRVYWQRANQVLGVR